MFVKSITPEEIELMERAAFPGEIVVVDKLGKDFNDAVEYLGSQKIIGFDTESRPSFSPGQPHYGVSLLQLSGEEKAFLFRIKLMGLQRSVCNILANPDIIKVGAAVYDDIRGLKRYCSFQDKGFVDLQKIVEEYGITDKSVKKMAAIILGLKVSKTQQLSNWEAEVLTDPQKMYAATDAWVCLKMYNKLMVSEKNPIVK